MQPTFFDLTRTLSLNPRDVTALCTLGRMYAAAGRTKDATACFTQALQLEPQHPQSLLDFGMMLALAKRATEAQELLQRARRAGAAPGPIHFGLGLCKLESGDLEGAEADFRKAMRLEPRLPDAANNLGVTLDRLGRLEDAVNAFQRATRTHPDYPPPYANLGDALSRAGRREEAIAAFRQWANLEPRNADAHARLGDTQLAIGELHAASQSLRHALSIDPTLHKACTNLGEALRALHDFDSAADAFRQALRMRPDFAEAHLGLARVELARGRAEADSHLMMAARLRPSDSRLMLAVAKGLDSIGKSDAALTVLERFPVSLDTLELSEVRVDLLTRAGDLETSIAILERLIELQPARTDLSFRRADALEALGRCEEAVEQIRALPAEAATSARAYASLLGYALRLCDWALAERCEIALRSTAEADAVLHPFVVLATTNDLEAQARFIRGYATRFARTPRPASAPRYAHERLRIAYLSPDFRDHPVAYALAGVIERHDRSRFVPIGIALQPPKDEGIGARLRGAFEEFVDVSSLTGAAARERLLACKADVVVDLAGYTAGARPEILAERIAAVQINYLGFSGSMGADFMDFIVADEVVVPAADEPAYAERVLRMPWSYLPFDQGRSCGTPAARSDEGLADDAFVFCAFNSSHKITRTMFDVWMRLLQETPRSVLWLRSMSPTGTQHLQRAAADHGIAVERLVFASRHAQMERHLARLSLADLFLDSLPYNAHTTAAESLWAGVPVVSCLGRTFAGRVGGSLLRAARLEELLCGNLEEYFERALHLAREPTALRALRERLQGERALLPLFDTLRYTRDLEDLFERAWRNPITG